MKTGFATLPVDQEFARRSARYLASQGYQPDQIRLALVQELNMTDTIAEDIISVIAA